MGVILQDPTAKFRCTLGDRSFTAAAPKICNSLPDYIRKESDAGGDVVFNERPTVQFSDLPRV